MATIMVVDDEAVLVRFVVKALRGQGHVTMVAHDGPSALATLAQHQARAQREPRHASPVDLVIVDAELPKLDGWALAATMQATHGVPVVLMAATYLDYAAVAAEPGPTAVLARPFTRQTLLATVARVLGLASTPTLPC